MTGSGAVMPQAPSSLSPPAVKFTNSANAAEIDTAGFGAFSELFAALEGEADAPGDPESDANAQRDESAGLLPMPMFPEKTAQTRFAAELNATLPPGFAQGNHASVPPTAEAKPPETVEAAKVVSPAAPPVVGKLPVQPPVTSDAARPISSALPPDAAPAPANPPILPASTPANPVHAPRERNATKNLPHDGDSAIGELTAMTGTAPAETATSENRSSGQDGERGDTARTLAALKETKVAIVRQETHFAPGPQQSPALQIANRIMHDVEAADPAFTAQPAALPKDASAAPLKVLHIRLDPPELGALMIRMSLKNDMLHLQIEASRHDTARLIERDQNALSGMLRSAGYGVDGLTVQITTGDRGNGAQPFSGGNGFNQSAGQHFAGRQPENSGSEQAWQPAAAPERIAENGRETEAPGAHGRRGGPVYL